MDALTHLLVGRLLAEALGAPAQPLGWLATLFAVLPDFDVVAWWLPRVRRWVQHRGVTHTLPFGVGASAIAALVMALAGWAPFWASFAVALLAFLSHVSLDVLNWGAPVLWPWRRGRFEWTVHGGFAWSAALSTTGLLALGLAQRLAPSAAGALAAALGGGFVAYLALRAGVKLAFARRHPGRRLVPTGNPFVWRVVARPSPLPQEPPAATAS